MMTILTDAEIDAEAVMAARAELESYDINPDDPAEAENLQRAESRARTRLRAERSLFEKISAEKASIQSSLDQALDYQQRILESDNEKTSAEVTRDEIEAALRGAQKRLSRSSSASNIHRAKLIARILTSKPLTDHAEDAERAFLAALEAVVMNAPKNAPALLLAEFLATSRPDVPVDDLCAMVAQQRKVIDERPPKSSKVRCDREGFEVDQYDNRKNNSGHNLKLAVQKLGVKLRFNELERRVMFNGHFLEDADVIKLRFEMEDEYGFKPTNHELRDLLGMLAREDSYHEVRDYLANLPSWDKVSRVEKWLIDFAGADDNEYVRAVSKLVLVAAVRRAGRPGCKFDEMLILESPQQGTNKSTALRTLCPVSSAFTDNFEFTKNTQKMMEIIAGKWIIEAGELSGMSHSDRHHLKRWLSQLDDEGRKVYAHDPDRVPRQFVLIGTTNDTTYLKDITGDRRYWPVRIKRFDIDALAKARDQLWAEAKALDDANPEANYIRLDESLWDVAAVEQDKRRQKTAIEDQLSDAFAEVTYGRISIADVLKLVAGDPLKKTASNAEYQEIARVMIKLGWEKDLVTFGRSGKTLKARAWVRGTPDERKVERYVDVGGDEVKTYEPRNNGTTEQRPA